MGLDEAGSREVERIMREEGVTFDEVGASLSLSSLLARQGLSAL